MAAIASSISSGDSYIKALAESKNLDSVPSEFKFVTDPNASDSDSLPMVDYFLLTTGTPVERSKVLQDLAKACQEWGFFVLVNHGIPEGLLTGIVDASLEYFDLPDEEKNKYEPKSVSDPIKSSGSCSVVHANNYRVQLWRDYVKCYVHPEFHCPEKPQALRDTVFEYSKLTRLVYKNLIHAIWENLGLEVGYMDEMLQLDSHFQMYAANYYPPCPEPDQTIGIPAHTDPGLLTFLIHNGVPGLQIQHDGEWFNTTSPRNAILVNTADHLEILSNGRYKSVKHRAVVNTETSRISVVISNGAAPEAVVGPAAQLVERDGRAFYHPMKYMEYVETQLGTRLMGKTNLDYIKIDQED